MKILFINCGGTNAGDKYSCPLLFYNFNNYEVHYSNNFDDVNKYKNSIVIFGGGGIIDTNKDRNIYYNSLEKTNKYIHWGSGQNRLNLDQIKWKINSNEIHFENDILSNFILVGRRDYMNNYYNNHEYVPCVSCKLKQFKIKYENKRRIGVIQHAWLQQIKQTEYPSINMDLNKNSIDSIIRFIGESEIIITGSYHAAYWGFLLNKKVIINGNWSSKFDSLKYKPTLLTNNIEKDITNCVDVCKNYLNECIELNDNFYNKIIKNI